MTTSTYTYSFTAPGQTLTAPGGRFFYVKSATAPISISTRGDTTTPRTFDNIGAGGKFGPVSTPWRYLDLTSASVQNVELVISDEAEFDLGGTVNVAGTVATSSAPSSSFTSPIVVTIPVSNISDIAANPSRKAISFCALSSNADSIWIQALGAAGASGIELQPGTWVRMQTTAGIRVRNLNASNTAAYTTIEET